MNRNCLIIIFLIFMSIPSLLSAQGFTYKAEMVRMDSTWDKNRNGEVAKIIGEYKPEMDRLMQEVIGFSEFEMQSGRPESLLSNFAADALLEEARSLTENGDVDLALTNFGGLRATIPAGDIRRYHIFATFPFENCLVILDMTGKSIRELFESFASRRVEAFSHTVKMVAKDKVLTTLLINGEPVDDNRIYRLATIDFLLDGGDSMSMLKDAVATEFTGIVLRDIMVSYIQKQTKAGKNIAIYITNRAVID